MTEVPRHVAIIMDGNGRWAKSRLLPRVEGHRQGAKTVRMVVEESRKLGVRYLTLFAFSTENWQRPAEEVGALMRLFIEHLESEVVTLDKNGIRLRAIGDRQKLSPVVRDALERAEKKTESNKDLDLILALSYGGREEIVSALRNIVKDGIAYQEINNQTVREYLYAPDVPDPDLLIRTSDESRISNFLLWQLAYSEIVVTPVLWPEFSKEEYRRCLEEFAGRERRFGLTKEQLVNGTNHVS